MGLMRQRQNLRDMVLTTWKQSKHMGSATRYHSKPTPPYQDAHSSKLGDHTDPGTDSYPVGRLPAIPRPRSSLASAGAKTPPLGPLPLSHLLRTYLITTVSSSPFFLNSFSAILRRMLDSKSFLFSLKRNPLARLLLSETFYKQFCAGSMSDKVGKTCRTLRHQGYGGIILEYALEVLKEAEGDEMADVAAWRDGMLATVSMSSPGDFVALKWSGMGPAALRRCADQQPPSATMDDAMKDVCTAAAAKRVGVLPSAEEHWNLPGYHSWTLDLQRVFNREDKAVVYNTYQCYLRDAPNTVTQHLKMARLEGFTLGAKLVRGAYQVSEDRELIQPSIEATHATYNGIMASLIERKNNNYISLAPSAETGRLWPKVNVMVATHNAASVQLAQRLRKNQAVVNDELTPLTFAQLQGMADEVSCSLLAANREGGTGEQSQEQVFKFIPWGTMPECLNYLLRRAAENGDAVLRTSETRMAMGSEIRRRFMAKMGLNQMF